MSIRVTFKRKPSVMEAFLLLHGTVAGGSNSLVYGVKVMVRNSFNGENEG